MPENTSETVVRPTYDELERAIRNAYDLVGDAAQDADNPDLWNRGGAGYDAHTLLMNTRRALDGLPPFDDEDEEDDA